MLASMQVHNHLMTGAVIALAVNQPIVAAPLSLASHYVLDALPHFGFKTPGYEYSLHQRSTWIVVPVSAFLTAMLSVIFVYEHGFAVTGVALISLLPDVEGVFEYFHRRRNQPVPRVLEAHQNFHAKIQHFERPWGFFTEVAMSVLAGYLLIQLAT